MKILGLAGGHRRVEEASGPASGLYTHDGAAVLLVDGVVVAGCEQERIDRIKHSDKAPIGAVARVLELAKLTVGEIDRVAYYSSEEGLDRALERAAVTRPTRGPTRARALVASWLGADPAKLVFVKHHVAHAASAFFTSGWDESLVATFDGIGEDESGTLAVGRGGALETIASISPDRSLGQLYCDVIAFLGYGLFDEYKVMGLAPYGDPSRLRALFAQMVTLEGEGQYRIHHDRIGGLFALGLRRRGEPFTATHHDIAAALQELLLRVMRHVLEHARKATGQRRLCLAGGVAHNCTVNGELLRAGIFDAIHVQPAAHDAGCAIGAALHVHAESAKAKGVRVALPRCDHVFWGTDIGDPGPVLARWRPFLSCEKKDDVVAHAAERIAAGEVIGWVQGRAEFGPRALGNRSILADPRPAENKTRINAIVKKREGYRPFAPSVTLEEASRFFDVPEGLALPFMVFVVPVREAHRATLGAVTHVDGSARIQTVSEAENPRYWRLLRAFGERTGVPILLDTSFNNHAEPIVDSVEDAVVTFLTTGLDAMGVGDFWVVKARVPDEAWGDLVPRLARHVTLEKITARASGEATTSTRCHVVPNHDPEEAVAISEEAFAALAVADGVMSLATLVRSTRAPDATLGELRALWERRFVLMAPPT